MEQRLLTVKEVESMLKLGHSKTYELIGSGKIKSVKIGRSRRVVASELDRFIDKLMKEIETGEFNDKG